MSLLTVTRSGPVEHVLLNRPEVRNALNDTLIAELAAWASRAASDRTLRAAVLEGAGKAFCAGADVEWMARTVEYSEAENLRDAAALARTFEALDRVPVPLIGRIHGAALGGGAGLAAICDIAVAEEQALFGFTEVKLGIMPAVISPFVLAKIGRSAARELFLTGARFSATRAREIGLVHTVVAATDLDEAVASHVREVLSAGPESVAAAKRLIQDVWGSPWDRVADITTRAIAARRVSPEGQEGLRAFLAKRKPSWATDSSTPATPKDRTRK